MKFAFSTNIGRRSENEDSCTIPDKAHPSPFVAVSDGMGGHAAGAVASKLIIEGLREELFRLRPDDIVSQLRSAVKQVNFDVYRTAQDDPALYGMGATLVLAALFSGTYVALNVGDSRLYKYSDHTLTQISHDHTYVQMLVDSGSITPEEAKVHPQRNLITRSVGLEMRVEPEFYIGEWGPGDILLLCSDGLHGSVPEETMIQILETGASLSSRCRKLVDTALQFGASDNITAVLAEHGGGSQS